MKQGRNLKEISQQLVDEIDKKHDYIVDTRALLMVAPDAESTPRSLQLSMVEDHPADPPRYFDIAGLTHNQIGEHVGIPTRYYERMRAQAPELLARNVNHWFAEQPASRLVRTLDGRARAFLSNRYRPLDNADLMQAVMPSLAETELDIVSCELTDTRLYIKAVTPKVQGEVKKGDVVQAGVVISNSEVGSGALQVSPMLYRLVCLNGLIIEDDRMRRVHAGRTNSGDGASWEYFKDDTRKQSDKAVFMQARDLVSTFLKPSYLDNVLESMREAAHTEIESRDLGKVVEVTSKLLGLSADEGYDVLSYLAAAGDLTKWGLANAVTRASQDVADYDRATVLETAGSRIIELPQRDWSKISGAS